MTFALSHPMTWFFYTTWSMTADLQTDDSDCSAGSCDHRFAHFFHFSFVFTKTDTKFAARFTNVFKITVHTREAIKSVHGVVVHVLRFHHSADLLSDFINARKNCHTSTFICFTILLCDFLWCFLLHLVFNFSKVHFGYPQVSNVSRTFFFSSLLSSSSRCSMSWWHPIFGTKGGVTQFKYWSVCVGFLFTSNFSGKSSFQTINVSRNGSFLSDSF